MINRRQFLHSSSALLAGAATLGVPRYSFAATPAAKKLIVLFQRGGNDGLNTLVPYTEQAYYDLRPDIAIAAPDVSNANAALPLSGNSQFGFHPSLANLLPAWTGNDLAIFPAIHCGDNANTSHFFQWNYFDFGQHTANSSQVSDGKGWLGRYLENKHGANGNGIDAFNFDVGRFRLLKSTHPVLALSNPRNINLGTSSATTDAMIANLLAANAARQEPTDSLSGQWDLSQQTLFDNLDVIEQIPFGSTPQNGATYPDSDLGRNFSDIATMIRSQPELEVVSLSSGGWDTHSDQLGTHALKLADVGDALGAFRADMGSDMDDIMVVVMTEFGRTAAQNGSAATDHGRGACWMVMGGKVNGGIYGDWPGLSNADLDSGRWLKPTLDYRDVLSETLAFLGAANPESSFPEYTYSPLNFIDHT